MSNDQWPMVAGISAALAAAAGFGQVIVAAVQAGQQSGEDKDIKDLKKRVEAIEQQLHQNDFTSGHHNESDDIAHNSQETIYQLGKIETRVKGSARLDGYHQKEEFGEIFAQLEGTLVQNSLIDPEILPKKSWLVRFFERKGAEYIGR